MGALRGWVLAVTAAAVIAALADSLMPEGAVKRVGKLTCGLLLLAAVASPLAAFDPQAGTRGLEDYFASVRTREDELKNQREEQMKSIIEERFAAYIQDKAAGLGAEISADVTCREENGAFLPDAAVITGTLSITVREKLSALLEEELALPREKQSFLGGEGAS